MQRKDVLSMPLRTRSGSGMSSDSCISPELHLSSSGGLFLEPLGPSLSHLATQFFTNLRIKYLYVVGGCVGEEEEEEGVGGGGGGSGDGVMELRRKRSSTRFLLEEVTAAHPERSSSSTVAELKNAPFSCVAVGIFERALQALQVSSSEAAVYVSTARLCMREAEEFAEKFFNAIGANYNSANSGGGHDSASASASASAPASTCKHIYNRTFIIEEAWPLLEYSMLHAVYLIQMWSLRHREAPSERTELAGSSNVDAAGVAGEGVVESGCSALFVKARVFTSACETALSYSSSKIRGSCSNSQDMEVDSV